MRGLFPTFPLYGYFTLRFSCQGGGEVAFLTMGGLSATFFSIWGSFLGHAPPPPLLRKFLRAPMRSGGTLLNIANICSVVFISLFRCFNKGLFIMKYIYLNPTLYNKYINIYLYINIAGKVPNTVKIILMQFFTTIMEIEFIAMSITMVQN